jgi:hypothetical protein
MKMKTTFEKKIVFVLMVLFLISFYVGASAQEKIGLYGKKTERLNIPQEDKIGIFAQIGGDSLQKSSIWDNGGVWPDPSKADSTNLRHLLEYYTPIGDYSPFFVLDWSFFFMMACLGYGLFIWRREFKKARMSKNVLKI